MKRNRGKAIGTYAAWQLLGPPLGVTLVLAGVIMWAMLRGQFDGFISIQMLPMLWLVAYLFGGLQAGVCGLILAGITLKRGSFSYVDALGAALLVSLFHHTFFWWGRLQEAIRLKRNAPTFADVVSDTLTNPFPLFLTAASIGASLTLRWLFRNWISRPEKP